MHKVLIKADCPEWIRAFLQTALFPEPRRIALVRRFHSKTD